jgi:hypothetical protein
MEDFKSFLEKNKTKEKLKLLLLLTILLGHQFGY